MAAPCAAPAVPAELEPVPLPGAEQETEMNEADKHVAGKGEGKRE